MRIPMILTGSLLLISVNVSHAADNPQELRYSREQRFSVADNNGNNGTKNVVIQPVGVRDVPPFIVYQTKMIADQCTDTLNNANSALYYTYTSDYNRKNKYQPNYIIDLKSWKNVKMKPCFMSPPCENGQCGIVGFSAFPGNKWVRTFDLKASEWKPVQTKAQDKSVNTFIQIKTIAVDCKTIGGEVQTNTKDQSCQITYGWQANGLTNQSQSK